MLRSLRIQNIILIEEAELEFEPGFTVLTGETGAGKSAILKALGLVLGERADSKLIRKGASKARVEALFEISDLSGVTELLFDAGIECEDDELVMRRDLAATSKSRAYINNTFAQTSLIKKLGDLLLDLVGQHANLRLSSSDYQSDVLDLYGGLLQQRADFAQSWQQLCQRQKELETLVAGEAERLRTLSRLQAEVDELTTAAMREGEEEELFAEFSRLNHSDELIGTLSQVTSALDEQCQGLQQARDALTKAATLDAALNPQVDALKSQALELQEVTHELRSYSGRLDVDPARLAQVDERLSLLNALQKKYSDPTAYLEEATARLGTLENTDLRIEELQREVTTHSAACDTAASKLTAERTRSGRKLEKALVEHLRPLNMEGARFDVQITPAARTARGDDATEFLFAPNIGEGSVPVRQCASGGELSRLLLALKTALAGLELTPTLVFDEIDANIGGQTGRLVGQKLKSIATKRQVLCITHLPQVAREADHHFHICKQESGGRTHSTVTLLDTTTREAELTRMVGLTV